MPLLRRYRLFLLLSMTMCTYSCATLASTPATPLRSIVGTHSFINVHRIGVLLADPSIAAAGSALALHGVTHRCFPM